MTRKRETISIPEAANLLKIGIRSIYRYIDKGILNKSKTGKKSYLYLEEVIALQNRMGTEPDVLIDIATDKIDNNNIKKTVNLEQQHYEALLIRLGQLEAQKELLLEYKTDSERKDLELKETRNWFEETLKENKKIINDIDKKNNELTKLKDNLNQLQKELEKVDKIKSKNNIQENLLTKKDSELEELKKNMAQLRQELHNVKSRNIFKRIFNK